YPQRETSVRAIKSFAANFRKATESGVETAQPTKVFRLGSLLSSELPLSLCNSCSGTQELPTLFCDAPVLFCPNDEYLYPRLRAGDIGIECRSLILVDVH